MESIRIDILITQIANFLLLFFVTKRLFGDKFVKSIEERKKLIKKLKNADDEYIRLIELARKESDNIISKANKQKESIIEEGKTLAEQERKLAIELGNTQKDLIIQEAQQKSEKMLNTSQEQRINSVVETAKLVVKKIFNSQKELKDAYLELITAEATKMAKKKPTIKPKGKLGITANVNDLSFQRTLDDDLTKLLG